MLPIPGQERPESLPEFVDPVAQTWHGENHMPCPISDFPGLEGSDAGGRVPPDTNGDVGLTHTVQTVHVGIGTYDKVTGTELVQMSFDDLFNGAGTLCDTNKRGDPIVLYDALAGRVAKHRLCLGRRRTVL